MGSAKREELASLVYHDIFDYPLTKDELKRWRLGKEALLRSRASDGQAGKRKIENKQGYFFLKGRSSIVKTRRERQKFSENKKEIATGASRLISRVPTVKFIGLTGAVAMLNAGLDSDIDFLVIVEKGTLWTTRLATLLILDLFGIRRRRAGHPHQKDRLCLNIWLDESDLVWSKDQRNIYTGHEICQIVPLYDKDGTWRKFLSKNSWVREYWPEALDGNRQPAFAPSTPLRASAGKRAKGKRQKAKGNPIAYCFLLLAYLFEPLARTIQLWYMKPKVTREVVTKTRAIFHPHPLSQEILENFKKKLGEV